MSDTLGIAHLYRCSNGLLAQLVYIVYVYNITVNKYIYIYTNNSADVVDQLLIIIVLLSLYSRLTTTMWWRRAIKSSILNYSININKRLNCSRTSSKLFYAPTPHSHLLFPAVMCPSVCLVVVASAHSHLIC